MKIAAAPFDFGFDDGHQAADLEVILYGHADVPRRAGVGFGIPDRFRKRKWRPENRAWDFLSLALAVQAADGAVTRAKSPDGWTREIDLTVSVIDPDFWNTLSPQINETLRFLTTDIWNVRFQTGGLKPPPPKSPVYPQQTSVSLLSGGLDSLTGGIDLVRQGKTPFFVSQVSDGDKTNQIHFASTLGQPHLQLNHVATSPGIGDNAQRARSIVFFAYGVLMASSLFAYQKGLTVPLYVCENGLISLNPALTPMRLGSLSTRTTHPIYLAGMQGILAAAGLRVAISNPYQFRTKGEMLKECLDQGLLQKLASSTTSCGRFARNGFRHCGRCIPCLIRRASFHAWGTKDHSNYRYKDLSKDDAKHAGFDDVRAMRMAAEIAPKEPERLLGATLSSPFIPSKDIPAYKATVVRGMTEVRDFLIALGVK